MQEIFFEGLQLCGCGEINAIYRMKRFKHHFSMPLDNIVESVQKALVGELADTLHPSKPQPKPISINVVVIQMRDF